MSTLVKATKVQASSPGSAADVLKQYPRSPYTAFLVTKEDQVESYDQHCARLLEGLGVLAGPLDFHCLHELDVGAQREASWIACFERYLFSCVH